MEIARPLKNYSQTTFATKEKIKEILLPKDTKELVSMVVEANTRQYSIYVCSRGMNYGYGNTVPIKDNSILIDLSLLNQIDSFDRTHGTIIIAPGVTFKDVFEYLKSQGDEWIMAGTGAPIDSSPIGNLAERGIGKGLVGNRSDFVCNLEVVLPTGEIIHTNMGKYENCKVKDLTRWGPGPQVDGLFIQSNLGIITKATFWLTPKPKYFSTFVFSVDKSKNFYKVIDALRELKQKDIIRANIGIFNDYRLLGLKGIFPWDKWTKPGSLPRSLAQTELKQFVGHNALWIGEGALFCHSQAQLKAEMAAIKKLIRRECKYLLFFNKFNTKIYKGIARLLGRKKLAGLIDNLYAHSGYLGTPMPFTLESSYWRKKTRPKIIAPIKDGCGLIWLGPMIPFAGKEVERAIAITEKIIFRYGLEPAITLQAITARQIDMIISITYDRLIPGQDQLAMDCHDELILTLIKCGYYPYRLGIQSMDKMPATLESTGKKLKAALDPKNIFAPGRYPG